MNLTYIDFKPSNQAYGGKVFLSVKLKWFLTGPV